MLGFGATAAAQSQLSSVFAAPLGAALAAADTVTGSNTYYFPHLAFGGGFQTTLTYVNYSPQPVHCTSTFLGDDGSPLQIPFGTAIPTDLSPGASFHIETRATGGATGGWGQAQCNGPVKASLLYRFYNGASPVGEAGVNASSAPATEFVTYAESHTGIALANPSPQTASITINAINASGQLAFSSVITLAPNAHFAANLNDTTKFPTAVPFGGSVQILSPGVPIVALSLNAEAFPSFSSLPAGDLPDGTPLATGH